MSQRHPQEEETQSLTDEQTRGGEEERVENKQTEVLKPGEADQTQR